MAKTRHLIAVIAVLHLLGGCSGEEFDNDTFMDDDTTAEPSLPCEDGYALDLDLPEEFMEDFPDGCVPAACGVGRWGNMDLAPNIIYVDAGAVEDGDGSEEAPFTSIQVGLDTVGDSGSHVVVAAGTYIENLLLTEDHDGVQLVGRCQALVVVEASGGEEEPGILAEGFVGEEAWRVSGISVTEAPNSGISLEIGTLSIARASLVGNRGYGAFAGGRSSSLVLSNVDVLDTQPNSDGNLGRGLNVREGASLQAEDCRIEGNAAIGIFVSNEGTTVRLSNVEVTNTKPEADGTGGRGIEVNDGASLQAEDCLVEGNADVGVILGHEGTTVRLSYVEVKNTKPGPDGSRGRGISVLERGALLAEDCRVDGNTEVGVFVDSEGMAHLSNVEVKNTKPIADGTGGRGINVQEGASLQAEDCLVEGNADVGFLVAGESVARLSNVEVKNTQPKADGTGGRGIEVQDGASLQAEDCWVEGNAGEGIFASSESTAHLSNVEVRNTQPRADGTWARGIAVQDLASLSAENCRIGDNVGRGIEVNMGASLEAHDCLIEDNVNVGIVVGHEGTTVRLSNVKVKGTKPIADGTGGRGIEVSQGASLEAHDCLVEGNIGIGIIVGVDGATAHLSNVEVRDTHRPSLYTTACGLVCQEGAVLTASDVISSQNEGPGLFVASGGTLTCTGCDLSDNAFAGALVWGDGIVELSETTIVGTTPDANEGGGIGIYATDRHGPSTLFVDNTTIEDQPYAAVWLDGGGSYAIRNSTLVGGYGMELEYPNGTSTIQHGDAVVAVGGVPAWDGASGLLIEGNEIRDAYRAGIILGSSSATLTSNSFTGNTTDLIWQDCESVDEPGGLNDVPVVDYCPRFNHHITPLEFNLILEEAEILE